MKLLSLPLGLLIGVLAFNSSPANPARSPKRMVHGQTVDLSPLLHWWPKQRGERPLAAWPQVTGKIVGTNAFGWIVRGAVEETGKKDGGQAQRERRFVLKSPPVAELAEFHRLEARLNAMQHERDAARREVAHAEAQQKLQAERRQELREQGRRGRIRKSGQPMSAQEKRATKQDIQSLDAEIKQADAALQKLPNAGGNYEVDCFAFKTGQEYQGLPVYDHGVVLR